MRTLIGYVLRYAPGLWEGGAYSPTESSPEDKPYGTVTGMKKYRTYFMHYRGAVQAVEIIRREIGKTPKIVPVYRVKKEPTHPLRKGDKVMLDLPGMDTGKVLWHDSEGVLIEWKVDGDRAHYRGHDITRCLATGTWKKV